MKKRFIFGCKAIFEHKGRSFSGRAHYRLYEEQIFIVRAVNAANARKMALRIARESASASARFCGLVGIHFPLDQDTRNGAEVFCSLRESRLQPTAYITRHYKSANDYEIAPE